MRVIAIDPGKTNGVAFINYSQFDIEEPTWQHWERVGTEATIEVLDGCAPSHIIIEKFQPRDKIKINTQALELTGAVEHWAATRPYPVEVVYQMPSLGKGFWSNEKLKLVGLYHKGYRHANDATRHLLYWYTKNVSREFVTAIAGLI